MELIPISADLEFSIFSYEIATQENTTPYTTSSNTPYFTKQPRDEEPTESQLLIP